MPVPTYPVMLFHDMSRIQRDAHRYDDLCAIAVKSARPIVEAALKRETSEETTREWFARSKFALSELLKTPQLLNMSQEQGQNLSTVVTAMELPQADQVEIEQSTGETARMMMASWIRILRDGLIVYEGLDLADDLLPIYPAEQPKGIRDKLLRSSPVQLMMESVAAFPVNRNDTLRILRGIGDQIAQSGSIALPCGIVVRTSEKPYVPSEVEGARPLRFVASQNAAERTEDVEIDRLLHSLEG
jgi:hypothetical protein